MSWEEHRGVGRTCFLNLLLRSYYLLLSPLKTIEAGICHTLHFHSCPVLFLGVFLNENENKIDGNWYINKQCP